MKPAKEAALKAQGAVILSKVKIGFGAPPLPPKEKNEAS